MSEVKLPELGDGIEKAIVACINSQVGDQVNCDDDLLEVVTDKATFNISSDTAGIVRKVLVKANDEVAIGQPLMIIE